MPFCNGVDTDWNIIRLERVQTSRRCLNAREFGESFNERKQMTEVEKLTGAASGLGKHWQAINWQKVDAEVKRLQMRIAKAGREGKSSNKVKALQWLLSHSYCAKLLAVKRVTSNKGAKTPGVDREIWNTPKRKMKGAISLIRKGYNALPLRRILIPKKNGKKRPLGIPTIKDRAMQASGHPCSAWVAADLRADSRNNG